MAHTHDNSGARTVKIVVWSFALLEVGLMGFAIWRHLHTGGQ